MLSPRDGEGRVLVALGEVPLWQGDACESGWVARRKERARHDWELRCADEDDGNLN